MTCWTSRAATRSSPPCTPAWAGWAVENRDAGDGDTHADLYADADLYTDLYAYADRDDDAYRNDDEYR